jgi:hypothetical protein
MAFAARAWWQTRARGTARRFALRQLKDIEREYEQHKNPVEFGARLSALLRRTMLAYAPRPDVAGLTGDAWLQWLDQGLAKPLFSNGPGRQIVELPYKNPNVALPASDVDRLLAAVRHRVATPVGGKR